MKVYAKVRIGKIFETTKQTPTDMSGGTNPIWNYDMSSKYPRQLLNKQLVLRLSSSFTASVQLRRINVSDRLAYRLMNFLIQDGMEQI